MLVANPIYDVVFKYLMEDERIARTILSALLKTEVLEVHVRRNEYSDKSRESLSIFRIDFGATIRNENGERQTILIEIQKTWVDSELLRFRRYLGVQYDNKENMEGTGRNAHALPMVAVYLLGHTVGTIEAPVVYVDHQVYDYDRNVVEGGINDPFVESLTHNSIIVQIPRLHGKINNRLDKVLSIFDQSRVLSSKDQQTINIDPAFYGDDTDMEPILRRLMEASCDSDVRREMDVEDEFFSVLKNRETEILEKNRQLAEKSVALKDAEKKLGDTEKKLDNAEKKLDNAEKKLGNAEKKLGDTEKKLGDTEKKLEMTEEQRAQAEEQRAQAEEQRAQAEERAERITRNSVKALYRQNMSVEDISGVMGIDVETVKRMVEEVSS